MTISIFTRIRLCVTGTLLVFSVVAASAAQAANGRDILWEIVSTCLNTTAADYCTSCRWPRIDSSCSQTTLCKKTTEVWSESEEFIALRDAKMCECPKDFVHGLVLPRARVTGVEDPSRPDGIWAFAWNTGTGRVKDTSALALVVNPPGSRSQDQLHIHIVRLTDDALHRIARRPAVSVRSLDEVWSAAAKNAAAQDLSDYGVLVIQHPEGGFRVLVEKENFEKMYTKFRCR